MFSHALDDHSYPKDRFLEDVIMNVIMTESWSIMAASNWDFSIIHMSHFKTILLYVVETRTCKDIIVRYAAHLRLGLLKVLCKNISKSVSAIENKTNTNSRDSFQDHYLKIVGKMLWRNQRVASKSFQDYPTSSFKTMARCTCTETPFKTPADTHSRNEHNRHKLTHFKTLGVDSTWVIREMHIETPFKSPANMQKRNEKNRHKMTHFKTPVFDGICITRGKDDANRVKYMVKYRGKKTSFKTLGKSRRKKVSFREKEHMVSKANSFNTPVKDTNKKSISFKTFDDCEG